jgi:hypothetical protein
MDETNKEKFSWSKFFSGLSTSVGWAKSIMMIIKIVLIVAVIATPVVIWRNGYNKAKTEWYQKGYIAGDAYCREDVAKHPTQQFSGTGTTVNNNVCPPPTRKVGLSMGGLGTIGWCENK